MKYTFTLLAAMLAASLAMTSNASLAADAVVVTKVAAKKIVAKKITAKKPAVKKSKPAASKSSTTSKPLVVAGAAAGAATVAAASSQHEELIALASRFTNGNYGCEFNEKVIIEKRTDNSGIVSLTHKGVTTPMTPVATNTGALRLENKTKGLMWLQLPTKSMLMNSKIGQRMADDCQPS